ncbi:MAG: peptidase M48 family protein [Proteobacteria bacterium]|nr:peptidase M48 family protein [Pseudomonadota bacterium]
MFRQGRADRGIRRALAVALLLLAVPHAAQAEPDPVWSQLRHDDLRLAAMVERLATANTALCHQTMPGTGLVLHALDQYPGEERPAARAAFGFAAPLAVEAVVPGSPAAQADVRADDAVLAVNGRRFEAPLARDATTARRDAALAWIEAAPPDRPLVLEVQRGGASLTRTIQPRPSCLVRAELAIDEGTIAHADDRLLQISSALLDRFDDDGLAVVVAHEFAHIVLQHGAKRIAAGVKHGWAGEFGRSARLTRAAEDEADSYSVRLLANAGFDPQIAVRFWRGAGRSLDYGLLRGATHSSAEARARTMAAAIAQLGRPPPRIP